MSLNEKNAAFEQIKALDAVLENLSKDLEASKLKETKKDLRNQLQEIREVVNSVVLLLRNVNSLNLQNHVIAELNNVAYRQI